MHNWEVLVKSRKINGVNEELSLYRNRITGAYAVSDDTGEGNPDYDEGGTSFVDSTRKIEISYDKCTGRLNPFIPVISRGMEAEAYGSPRIALAVAETCGLKVTAPQAVIDLIRLANYR